MENTAPTLLIGGSSALLMAAGIKAEALGAAVIHCSGSPEDIIDTVRSEDPRVLLTEIPPGFSDDHTEAAAGLINKLCKLFPDTVVIAVLCTNVRSIITRFSPEKNLRLAAMPMSPGRLAAIAAEHAKRKCGNGLQPDIADFLREKGFSEKLSGFTPVCNAVEMCIKEPRRLQDMMNAVYNDVGERSGSDGKTAERLIRFMSLDVHKNGLTPCLSRGETCDKLTNNELICLLCDSFTAQMKAFGTYESELI